MIKLNNFIIINNLNINLKCLVNNNKQNIY